MITAKMIPRAMMIVMVMIFGVIVEGQLSHQASQDAFAAIACAKLNATETYFAWKGNAYSSQPNTPQRLLFKLMGFRAAKCFRQADGSYAYSARDVEFYLDPVSHLVMDKFVNFDNVTVPVVHVAKDPVSVVFPAGAIYPTLASHYATTFMVDKTTLIANPLAPTAAFVPYYSGSFLGLSEFYKFVVPAEDYLPDHTRSLSHSSRLRPASLHDEASSPSRRPPVHEEASSLRRQSWHDEASSPSKRRQPSWHDEASSPSPRRSWVRQTPNDDNYEDQNTFTDVQFSLVRVYPWLPWMRLGNRTGNLLFSTSGFKYTSFNAIDPYLQQMISQRAPLYQHAPSCIVRNPPSQTEFTYFIQNINSYMAAFSNPNIIFPTMQSTSFDLCAVSS